LANLKKAQHGHSCKSGEKRQKLSQSDDFPPFAGLALRSLYTRCAERFLSHAHLNIETEMGGHMKMKTALKVSLVVNALFVMAVGYMLATDVEVESTPAFIYVTNAPNATVSTSLTMASH
jgi:hypothetical protein